MAASLLNDARARPYIAELATIGDRLECFRSTDRYMRELNEAEVTRLEIRRAEIRRELLDIGKPWTLCRTRDDSSQDIWRDCRYATCAEAMADIEKGSPFGYALSPVLLAEVDAADLRRAA